MRSNADCLIFQTSSGESFAFSAELVAAYLIGGIKLDSNVIRKVAGAVVHHFRIKLGREHVSVPEFGKALWRILLSHGYITFRVILPPFEGNLSLN